MDLETTWQEHKRFIVSVGGGAILFTALASLIGGIDRSAEALSRKNLKSQRDVLQDAKDLQGQESAEKGKAQLLDDEVVPTVRDALLFTVDSHFVLDPSDTNPGLTCTTRASGVTSDVQKIMSQPAVPPPVDFKRSADGTPSLGFSDPSSFSGPKAAEALARYDVTRRVMKALVEAGVRKLTDVTQPEATYEPLESDEGYLRTIPVEVSFEGTTASLAKLLATFQKSESFLEVAGCQVKRTDSTRSDDARIDISLKLEALTIEKDIPAGTEAGSGEDRPSVHSKRRRSGER